MIPIALQLYSVHEDAAADLAGVLRKVADMGYTGVEFAGFHNHPASDVKKMLGDAGLPAVSSHARWDWVMDPTALPKAIDDHLAIGCDSLVIPYMDKPHRDTPDTCRATGAKLTALTDTLAKHNLRTGYHNHHDDMRPLDGGPSAWDLIAQNTPDAFILQYDTANGMQGGADPVAPIRQYPGRGRLLHLKEYARGHGQVIGEGDVPWPQVFEAAESVAGVEWYIVEQEGHADLTPMQAARRCLENLRAMGK